MDQSFLTLSEHFTELKKRTIYVLTFFLCSFAISYLFSENIYAFLLKPLANYYSDNNQHGSIIYTSLTEAFFTYLKISAITATFFTVPFFTIQLFSFIAPALNSGERKVIIFFLISIPILFFCGAFVAYYFVFPSAWKFFLSFENSLLDNMSIKLEARISEYLNLSSQIILAFGLAFQMPVILTLLNRVGLLSLQWLCKQRRLAIVLIFIIAAIITPPDVLSQLILASIMILLYEFSILMCILVNRRKIKEKELVDV
jgi:sec-independent protein translocase protein TatC